MYTMYRSLCIYLLIIRQGNAAKEQERYKVGEPSQKGSRKDFEKSFKMTKSLPFVHTSNQ